MAIWNKTTTKTTTQKQIMKWTSQSWWSTLQCSRTFLFLVFASLAFERWFIKNTTEWTFKQTKKQQQHCSLFSVPNMCTHNMQWIDWVDVYFCCWWRVSLLTLAQNLLHFFPKLSFAAFFVGALSDLILAGVAVAWLHSGSNFGDEQH